MDTQRAAQLVTDDALESRGLAFRSSDLLAAEYQRSVDEPSPGYELTSYGDSGTAGAKRGLYDSPGLDRAAHSAAWGREAEDGPDEGEAESEVRRASYARIEAGRRRGHRASAGAYGESEKADKQRLRILWWRSAAINVLFILAWYCFSTLISLYNKWMFSADHYNFPYPLFVTSVHMLVQWLLAALTLTIFPSLRPKTRPLPRDYATKVAPCGVATGLDIGLSNLSLRSITLSFYTMCKSSSLAFVLIFAFLFRLEVPSWRLVGIILIITAGVILMVSTETQFDFVGMVQVLTASALGGLRWSLTQLLLHKESMGMHNPIATLFWLAPCMGITLALCSIIFDGWGNVFSHEEFWGTLSRTLQTSAAILFPGLLAFSMNVTEFGLIQRTSVVTLSVAGIFKEVVVIFLSTVLFHDELTPINISGLCVTIFGIALYNYLKYRQFTQAGGDPHGHGARPRLSEEGERAADGVQFDSTDAEEGAPMLPTGASASAAASGSTAHKRHASTASAGRGNAEAPHHALGSASDSDDDYADLDAQAAELLGDFDAQDAEAHSLQRLSENDKAHQHDRDRIGGLDELVEEDEAVREAERRTEALEREFEQERQRRDLLGDDDDEDEGGRRR
ncbi:hypothetical protein Rhopal_005546-T1 [Rhodotorula paludigena]|uniref:Sugar phosphate transporter domain-containing protein n=1 Tax=Rhodotorula paludigena TaxID=86838 RepID=A0AAV5GSM5_9BASI|nr:hypothetical protein Rhopal_005546-T1 [Rhodotorula paludigena]